MLGFRVNPRVTPVFTPVLGFRVNPMVTAVLEGRVNPRVAPMLGVSVNPRVTRVLRVRINPRVAPVLGVGVNPRGTSNPTLGFTRCGSHMFGAILLIDGVTLKSTDLYVDLTWASPRYTPCMS